MKPEVRSPVRRTAGFAMAPPAQRAGGLPRRSVRLSEKLLAAREAERRVLARDLHDGVGQSLVLLEMNLRQLRERLPPAGGSPDTLDASLDLVRELHSDIRRRALAMHSSVLDDLGIVPALRSHIAQVARSTRIHVEFDAADTTPLTRWPIGTETSAFRIAQEAITNALRHSQASRIEVHATKGESRLEVRVHDDGVGFDAVAKRALSRSLGLVSMAERARLAGGRLTITSAPNRGTTVTARFQLLRSRRTAMTQ